ncbi:MAG: aspartate carbamoyltransferase catalytic subunit [Calditrichota bacterium]
MSQIQLNHLLGLHGVSREVITDILDTADSFLEVLERPIPKVPSLRGVTIANLFFESSTRTRFSFELAEKRLSADVVNFSASGSSVSKGETLLDTVRNIEAMKIDVVVIRHNAQGAPHFLAGLIQAAVVNAGDGSHEHPTQALLDMMTVRRVKGSIQGLKILILGDIAHSRVARSNIFGLISMGASVTVCGPATLIPREIETLGVSVTHDLDEALRWCDVVNVLRLQQERMKQGYVPSLRDYQRKFGLTRARLETAGRDILVMHPGPMNRGVEIDTDVADGPASVILRQVTHGVAVRMAVLYLISGKERSVE